MAFNKYTYTMHNMATVREANLICRLSNFEDEACFSESEVLCWYVAIKEDVYALSDSNGHGDHTIHARHSI